MSNNSRIRKKTDIYPASIFKLALFLALIVSLSACKSSRSLVTSEEATVSKTHEKLIEDILKSEVNYKTISGKVALELISENKTSGMKINTQLKIIRNQILQLSIRAPFINTEVFRLNITPDSVFVIDRMAKRYAVEDVKKLAAEKNIPFNYANLQSLFTNALFLPGNDQVQKTDHTKYSISLNSGKYNLVTKDKSGLKYDFTVNSNDRITSTHISKEGSNYTIEWGYSDFIQDAEYIYPTKMPVKIKVKKKERELVMSYSGLDIDKELKVDRSLPSNYQRVSVMDILKDYIK